MTEIEELLDPEIDSPDAQWLEARLRIETEFQLLYEELSLIKEAINAKAL